MLNFIYRHVLVTILSSSLLFSSTINAQVSSGQSTVVKGISADSVVSSITMLAVGLVATRLYKYKMTPDIMLAAAGGMAFIYAEISSNNKFKEISKDIKVSADSGQIDSLKRLRKSYQDALNTLQNKYTFEKVSTVAFTAASASNAIIYLMDKAKFTACTNALSATKKIAISQCPALLTEVPTSLPGEDTPLDGLYIYVKSISGARNTGFYSQSSMEVTNVVRNLFKTKLVTVGATLAARATANSAETAGTAAAGCAALNTSYTATAGTCSALETLVASEAFTSDPTRIIAQNNPTHPLEQFVNLILPEARALDTSIIAGLGGAAAGMLLGFIAPTIGIQIDQYLFSPSARASIWSMFSMTSLMAAISTKAEIEKVESNIKNLDLMIKATVNIDQQPYNTFNKFLNFIFNEVYADSANLAVQPLAQTTTLPEKFPCLTGPGNSNCQSLTNALTRDSNFPQMPSDLQNSAIQISSLADMMSGTNVIDSKLLTKAESVASLQPKLLNQLDQLQKTIDDQNRRNGIIGSEFFRNEKTRELFYNLNESTAAILKYKGTTPNELIASYGGTPIVKTDANTSLSQKVPPPVFKDTNTENKNIKIDPKIEMAAGLSTTDNQAKNYKYNDINTDKDESIFVIISSRYFKTGIPRLLEQ